MTRNRPAYTQPEDQPVQVITERKPVATTLGVAVTVIIFVIGGTGFVYKAGNDLERRNDQQDSDIAALRDKVTDVKETLAEIRADVKSLLRNKP